MHKKLLALLVMLEDGNLDTEKARMLLMSVMEQLEMDNNEEALKFAQKAFDMIPEEGDADPGLMDTLGDLVWAIAKLDIDPIEKFLVERHGDMKLKMEHIQHYRKCHIMTEHLSLDHFRLFVWFRTIDKSINEICFLDDNKQPKVIDFKGLVDADADEESQFESIRVELKSMGI